jgi:hypothetical protein
VLRLVKPPGLPSRTASAKPLYNFGAGMEGRPTYKQVQADQDRKKKAAALEEIKGLTTALEHGISMIQGIDGPERDTFVDSYAKRLDGIQPGMGETYKALSKRPDMLTQFNSYAQYLPEPMQVMMKQQPKEFLKFAGTVEGQKVLSDAMDRKEMRVAIKKVQTTQIGLQKFVPADKLDAIMKDGVVTATDIMSIQPYLPKELQLTENENAAIQRNDKVFWQGLGVLHGSAEQDVIKNRALNKDRPQTRVVPSMVNGIRMEQQQEWRNGKWENVGDRVPHFKQDEGGPSIVPPEHADLHGEDYLKKIAAGEASLVKGVAEGRINPQSLSTRGGHRERILQMVAQFDPTFDSGTFASRSATRKDFTSGPTARNVTSINTAIGHLGTLQELGQALANKDTKAINYVANQLGVQLGKEEATDFEVAKGAVADELMRTFRGVGASEKEAEAWRQRFSTAGSPAQINGAITIAADLLGSRIQALDDQWKRGMGTEKGYQNLLSPKSKETFAKIGGKLERYITDEKPKTKELPPTNAKGWRLMTDKNGRKAYVGPNNEIEEVK